GRDMRRYFSILRKPVVLLALAFAACVGLFWWWMAPRPEYRFKIRNETPGYFAFIDSVSGDGKEVTVGLTDLESESGDYDHFEQIWDATKGRMISSNQDNRPEELPESYKVRVKFEDKHGTQFPFQNEATWQAFLQYLCKSRARCLAEARKT